MECPNCGTINAKRAKRCGCGCDLETEKARIASEQQPEKVKIKPNKPIKFRDIIILLTSMLFLSGIIGWFSGYKNEIKEILKTVVFFYIIFCLVAWFLQEVFGRYDVKYIGGEEEDLFNKIIEHEQNKTEGGF